MQGTSTVKHYPLWASEELEKSTAERIRMIKYQFAKDENGKLINIKNIKRINDIKSKFFCIACGNELTPRLGSINIHHFAHKKSVDCSGETYLHLLGKQLFLNNYTECLEKQTPFFIELIQEKNCNHYEKDLGCKCNLENNLVEYDLTKYFDKIELEKKEGEFIPDIILSRKQNNEKVFIEVAVTHYSSFKKKNSDYKIIEISAQSEDDFEIIRLKRLSINDKKITFQNFNAKPLDESYCKGYCHIKHNLLTLNKEGKCMLTQKTLKQINSDISQIKQNFIKYEISDDYGDYYGNIFKSWVAKCASENLNVRNCFICRYHADNISLDFLDYEPNKPIFCKYLKIKCSSNEAVRCKFYKLESEYVSKHLFTRNKDYEDEFTNYE